jgi:hypothetical protein
MTWIWLGVVKSSGAIPAVQYYAAENFSKILNISVNWEPNSKILYVVYQGPIEGCFIKKQGLKRLPL